MIKHIIKFALMNFACLNVNEDTLPYWFNIGILFNPKVRCKNFQKKKTHMFEKLSTGVR